MKCANCKESLIAVESEGVEVDWCAACGGVWLDRGELERIHGDAASAGAFLKGLHKRSGASHPARKCPICSKRMDPVQSAWDAAIVLDECPGSHGLWFDRGELGRVLKTAPGSDPDRVRGFLTAIFGHGSASQPH